MDEANSEIEQTWQKIERDSKKAGYRDGISDGRDSNFQNSFDIGFKEGFKNGFALGLYKGALFSSPSTINPTPLLEKTSRGNCQICGNEELLKENISEIVAKQTEDSNKNLNKLHLSYAETSSIKLPKQV